MDNEYRQSFTYARITPYRNHIKLSKKEEYINSCEINEELGLFGRGTHNKKAITPTEINLNTKSNIKFFHTTTPTKEFIRDGGVVPIEEVYLIGYKNDPSYYDTTKDRHIRRHYNNPFSTIEINRIDRYIRRDGDKITLKLFNQTRTRKVNWKFFNKSQTSVTITFDMVKGNFTVITYSKGGRMRGVIKRFYTNSFSSLENAISHITSYRVFTNITQHNPDTLNNMMFMDQVSRFFVGDMYDIPSINFKNAFIDYWMKRFIILKKIKAPDEFERLLKYHYPTEVYLKKNDRKLASSVLDKYKIKSNVTIKILHKYPNIDFGVFVKLCRLMGDNYSKYFGNINDNYFKMLNNTGKNMSESHVLTEYKYNHYMSKMEKENIVHILNDEMTTHDTLFDIIDHFRMMGTIRKYYPDIKLTSKKLSTFNQEHARISALIQTINRGYSIRLKFDTGFIKDVEQPIEVISYSELSSPNEYVGSFNPTIMVFNAKLLTTSEEYIEEGSHMHHCVSSYINYSTSIIISLRYGKERVTCEYDSKSGRNIQSRFINNGPPPKHFLEALNVLHNRIIGVKSLIKFEKERIPLLLNGVPIESPFVSPGVLAHVDFDPVFNFDDVPAF